MSSITYNKLWHEAQMQLNDLLQVELPKTEPKPENDKVAAFQLLATLYVKYVQTFRRLEECYDQITHAQKRRILRHVLDGVIGRLIELKHEMIGLELSEYHFFDDVLQDLKLTPNDIELPIPKYFVIEKVEAFAEKEKLLSDILSTMEPKESKDKTEISMSIEEAIRLIQTHERARQGRARASMYKNLMREMERQNAVRGESTMDKNLAAIAVQRRWRGHITRKKAAQMREEEFMFLGMEPTPLPKDSKQLPQYGAKKTEERRREIVKHNEKEYQQGLVSIKEKIRQAEGPDMKERMISQIRQWFLECRDVTGKFPEYPDEDEGGSAMIFKNKSVTELEKEMADIEAGGKEEKGKKDKKDSKDKKKDKKDKKDKGKDKKGDDEGWTMAPSAFVPNIVDGTENFKTVWENRKDTQLNQAFDAELVKDEKRIEVEETIRLEVDELMREELKNLKAAIDKSKDKKKKKKSKKKKKGKKKKKEKDLTPDKTITELFTELVEQQIIVKPQNYHLNDFEGDYSYLGTTLRQAGIEPMPSLTDARHLTALYGILPLGSESIHENAPLVKSVLITGPRGCGKKMLANIIANEVGATLFDLSPANIVGKYPGKDGLKMLIHLVSKVGKALEPTVILINDCEKQFAKKLSKADKDLDPKRLKKVLPKFMKGVKSDSRFLLVGTTAQPYDAPPKPLCKQFSNIIMIPRPDYASRFLLWKSFITKNAGILSNSLDISSLAKVSDGYTAGQILSAVKEVLTERRASQQQAKPLQAFEFIPGLARNDPIYKEEEEAYKKWWSKTPLGIKRGKATAEEEDGGKAKDKGKGKGKKA